MEKNKTIIIVVAVAIVVTIAAVIIFNKLRKSDDYTRDASREIDKNQISFSETEYKNLAEAMYDDMYGMGTATNSILRTLNKLKTKSDWLKLVEAFGIREGNIWNNFDEGNLIEWIIDEHDTSEMEEVRAVLSKLGVII